MAKGNIARGASVMVVSVTLTKILGLVYIIPLTRIIHTEGLGIYANAYALFVILQSLSTSGFPTAMAKLVSERLALKQYGDVEKMYQVTMRIVFALGCLLFLVMWFGAPLYSHLVALREPSKSVAAITESIRALAPALIVIPLVSGLRGYLQGFQEMEPSAWSQTIEQIVRIVAILVGAYLVMHHGGSVSGGAAAATFAAFVGGVAALLWLIRSTIPLRRQFRHKYIEPNLRHAQPTLSTGDTARSLYRIGLPVSIGNLVVPISSIVDSVTVQNLLMFGGMSFAAATSAYGILASQALRLVQLPLAFAMAIGVTILPAVSEALALRDHRLVESRVTGTFRSMMFMTLPVAATLLVLGRPVSIIMGGGTAGAPVISSVCFMGIFSSLELISTYILQGLGKMMRPVRNMMIGVFIKLVFNLLLIPHFHIMGAAIATSIGYLCSSTLNVLAVKKYGRLRFSVWRLSAKSILATLLLCVVLIPGGMLGHWLGQSITGRPLPLASIQAVVAVAIGGVVYVFASISLGAVTRSELQRIPFVGRRLQRFARS